MGTSLCLRHVATDGLPIRSGKAKVQDDAIGIDVDDVMCGGFEVIAGACLVSVELEQVRELVAQGRVIFDDVDDGHDGIPFCIGYGGSILAARGRERRQGAESYAGVRKRWKMQTKHRAAL